MAIEHVCLQPARPHRSGTELRLWSRLDQKVATRSPISPFGARS